MGFTPYITPDTSGSDPKRTYAHANAVTMTADGRMKLEPATSNPGKPPRTRPTWIAISVEFGPGMRLVAPRKSRNCSRVSHLRRETTSSSIIAMCAGGPPNATKPSFRKSRASSRREVRRPPEVRHWDFWVAADGSCKSNLIEKQFEDCNQERASALQENFSGCNE